MTNELQNNYGHYNVCDTHVHLTYSKPVEQTIKIFENIMNWFCYERIVLLSVHHLSPGGDPANNAKALYCKTVINAKHSAHKVYAFGNVFHYYDGRDTADGYLRQIELMDKLGFDGIKLLDGKPGYRKKLGKPLDDPIFDKFYQYAEQHNIPITLHLGDPASFWDKTQMSEYELKAGWFCDETYPTLEQLRSEVEGILTKFPKLRLNLAHFYFLGHDLEACVDFFERWENVTFDLCPGGIMFVGFSERHQEWKNFFNTYAHRLYFGTDTYNFFYSENLEEYEEEVGERINQSRRMLEGLEPFKDRTYGVLTPLNLTPDTLQKIYHDNCVRNLGEPRVISMELAAAYASDVLTKFEHGFVTTLDDVRDTSEMENLQIIYRYFQQQS